MEGGIIVMQDIFRYEQKGIDRDGRVTGEFHPTGVRPRFIERFKMIDYELPPDVFNER